MLSSRLKNFERFRATRDRDHLVVQVPEQALGGYPDLLVVVDQKHCRGRRTVHDRRQRRRSARGPPRGLDRLHHEPECHKVVLRIAQRNDDLMQLEIRTVAVYPLSDLLVPASPAGDGQGVRCAARIARLGRHDPAIRLPDGLHLLITEQISCSGIPAQNLAFRIEQNQCAILQAVHHELLEVAVRHIQFFAP